MRTFYQVQASLEDHNNPNVKYSLVKIKVIEE